MSIAEIILLLLQDVYKDLCSADGHLPKERVAQALRCLGHNPLQQEVSIFYFFFLRWIANSLLTLANFTDYIQCLNPTLKLKRCR